MSSQTSWGGPEPGPSLQECVRAGSGCDGQVSGAQKCGGASTRDRRLSRIPLGARSDPLILESAKLIGRGGGCFQISIHVSFG
jgi:hypothetical protein